MGGPKFARETRFKQISFFEVGEIMVFRVDRARRGGHFWYVGEDLDHLIVVPKFSGLRNFFVNVHMDLASSQPHDFLTLHPGIYIKSDKNFRLRKRASHKQDPGRTTSPLALVVHISSKNHPIML